MKTINNQIICTPFKKAHNEPVKKGKLEMIKTGTSLEALTVLVDAHVVNGDYEADIKKSQRVYVRADRYAFGWGKEKVTCGDLFVTVIKDSQEVREPIEFIVVPFSEVLMVE